MLKAIGSDLYQRIFVAYKSTFLGLLIIAGDVIFAHLQTAPLPPTAHYAVGVLASLFILYKGQVASARGNVRLGAIALLASISLAGCAWLQANGALIEGIAKGEVTKCGPAAESEASAIVAALAEPDFVSKLMGLAAAIPGGKALVDCVVAAWLSAQEAQVASKIAPSSLTISTEPTSVQHARAWLLQ